MKKEREIKKERKRERVKERERKLRMSVCYTWLKIYYII